MPHDFFKREYLHQAGWALLIGGVGFIGGTLFNLFQGPQEVVVRNLRTNDTVVVSVGEAFRRSDSTLAMRIDSLARLIQSARRNLTIETAVPSRQVVKPKLSRLAITPNAPLLVPYVAPANVKGWSNGKMAMYARTLCGPKVVKKGETFTQGFTLFDPFTRVKASPITVRITRRVSPTGGTQYLSQQYAWADSVNVVKLAADFPPGEGYSTEMGFYLLSDLDQEYPPFYATSCPFTIVE